MNAMCASSLRVQYVWIIRLFMCRALKEAGDVTGLPARHCGPSEKIRIRINAAADGGDDHDNYSNVYMHI